MSGRDLLADEMWELRAELTRVKAERDELRAVLDKIANGDPMDILRGNASKWPSLIAKHALHLSN